MPAITNLKFPRLNSKDLGFQVNRIKQYCMEQRKIRDCDKSHKIHKRLQQGVF